jgi:ferredoxin
MNASNINIDKEKCIGCSACVAVAPKSFQMNEENKAEVIDPIGDDETTIKNAVDSCPMGAIVVNL